MSYSQMHVLVNLSLQCLLFMWHAAAYIRKECYFKSTLFRMMQQCISAPPILCWLHLDGCCLLICVDNALTRMFCFWQGSSKLPQRRHWHQSLLWAEAVNARYTLFAICVAYSISNCRQRQTAPGFSGCSHFSANCSCWGLHTCCTA